MCFSGWEALEGTSLGFAVSNVCSFLNTLDYSCCLRVPRVQRLVSLPEKESRIFLEARDPWISRRFRKVLLYAKQVPVFCERGHGHNDRKGGFGSADFRFVNNPGCVWFDFRERLGEKLDGFHVAVFRAREEMNS